MKFPGLFLETANRWKQRDAKPPAFLLPSIQGVENGSGAPERSSVMTFSHSSSAALPAPSFETLMEVLDSKPQLSLVRHDASPGASLCYRSSPDGSVTMGTDPLSGQVVLIVQNGDQRWEIALPPKIARFASSETQNSLAAAKQVAEAAFDAYQASSRE